MPHKFPKTLDAFTPKDIRYGGMGLAAKLVLERKYSQAKQVLSKVLEVIPDDAEIMTLMAEVYHTEGKVEDAKAWLGKVFSISPDYPKAHYILGNLQQGEEGVQDGFIRLCSPEPRTVLDMKTSSAFINCVFTDASSPKSAGSKHPSMPLFTLRF